MVVEVVAKFLEVDSIILELSRFCGIRAEAVR
jgi:hypothetical protein